MALQKFQASDFSGKTIYELSNTPNIDGMTGSQLRQRFDAMPQQIADLINTRIIDGLASITDTSSGADNVGATAISGVSAASATVQAILEELASMLIAHSTSTTNPHSVTKSQVGLGNVDNTSDTNKPISAATQTALDSKESITDANLLIKTVSFTEGTGTFVFTTQGGTTISIDTNLEKVPGTMALVEDPVGSGTYYLVIYDRSTPPIELSRCPVTALFNAINVADTSTIHLSLVADTAGKKKLTADVIDGGITLSKLASTVQNVINASVTTVSDTSTIDLTLNNHELSASLKDGSVTMAKMDQTVLQTIEGYKDDAEDAADDAIAAATQASGYATSASGSATSASGSATSAGGSATSAGNSAVSASGSATSASASKLEAEGWAVGKQNGSDVSSSSPYYHNNAKWYCEQSQPGSAMLKGVYDTHNKNQDIFDYADSGVSAHDSSASAHSSLFSSKQDTLVSGTNIKTINGSAILGSGNIELSSSVASIVVSGAGNEALVTATKGTTYYTMIADENGKAIINVSEFGTYTISSSAVSGKTVSVVVDTIGTHKVAFTTLYCVRITRNTSSPSDRCTYLEDNADYESAYMNYGTGVFNYGSWSDAFFMPKPCMLKYDGTVDYYLNPNNYAQKLDGTASDIANTSYGGNVMIQFPTIWTKHTTDGTYDYIYVSDSKIDSNFECYSHRDKNGNVMPYCYMPAYCGSLISSKIRSISGQGCMNSQTGTNEITYARANNPSGFDIWDTEVLADRILIQDLLVLIGKSTNTQAVFGNGHYTGGSSASSLLQSGTMNSRGLFWGTNGTGNGVKVFGIENFWGNQWRRIRGWINANGTQKIKLTKGTYDGSTASDYNTDGSGYIAVSGATPSGTSGGYISTMVCTSYGRIPSVASGSETTYECDGLWFNNSQVDYAYVGGSCGNGFRVGAFCSHLGSAVSNSYWDIGASLSCKPIV